MLCLPLFTILCHFDPPWSSFFLKKDILIEKQNSVIDTLFRIYPLGNEQKIRADELMVLQKLAESRTKAQACILAGQVTWKNAKIEKSSQLLPRDSNLCLKNQMPYVGRGGLKMENFLMASKWLLRVSIFWTSVHPRVGSQIVYYKKEPVRLPA